ncbi:MAG TPA: thiopeptide-type bacteriocin biosynthesis protein [Nannocystaceae bacterium]|nr:thiopeptide-type bacteriocin biosynthesis protein [Nannocystaceae bacterium]
MSRAAEPGSWLQLDVDLGDAGGEMTRRADAVLSSLWARSDAAWWYLRKPPGLRVRIAGAPALPAGLAAVLASEREAGRIRGWVRGVYEPECRRFGGPAGLAVAHDFLSASAAAYLQLAALRRDLDAPIDATIAAVAIYDVLVQHLGADRPERWDVWARLAALYFGVRATPGTAARRDSAIDWSRLPGLAAPAERDVLSSAFAAAKRVAGAFIDAVRTGDTELGPRTFAVTLATFHWNVWAVERSAVRQACDLMLAELDPCPRMEAP